MSGPLSSRNVALQKADQALLTIAVPGIPPSVHETPDVAATFLEKMFAKHVAASECKEGFLKSAVGTFFMGDQNYGFWGGFEDEDSKHDAAMLCVPVMYDQLLRAIDGIQQQYERRAFIILGNPGLGKSSFLVYKAVKLLQEDHTVLWHSAGRFALYTNGLVYGLTEQQAKQVLRSRFDIHYLIDGVTPLDVHQASPMLMLLAHTPNRVNYKAMQRRQDAFAKALHFPEWDPPELERLWLKAYPDIPREQFEERLHLRGGNPRIVLARAKDESEHDSIDKALGRSTWQTLSAIMNPQSGITDGFSHQLCLIDVTDWRSGDFCKTIARPISAQIGVRIGQAAMSKYKVELATYVGAGGSIKDIQCGRGNWFERFALMVWAQGGHFDARDLAKEKTEVYQEAVTPLYLRNFMQPQSMQAAARVLTDILFLPNNKIFETVDAICPSRGYVVQNTVADKHDLKFDGLREVYKVFPGDTQVTVFFMVPPERFSTFKKPVLKFNEKGFEDGKPTPAAQAQYTKQANHTVEEEAEYRTSWVKPNKAEREQFHTDKQRAKNMRQVVVAVPISASSDVNTVILPIESFLHTPSSVAASPTMGSLSGSQLGSTPCDQQLVTSDSSNHQHLSSTESSSSRILFPGA